MVVVRMAMVVAVTMADAVAMAVHAVNLQRRCIQLVLRAGDVNVGVGFFGATTSARRRANRWYFSL